MRSMRVKALLCVIVKTTYAEYAKLRGRGLLCVIFKSWYAWYAKYEGAGGPCVIFKYTKDAWCANYVWYEGGQVCVICKVCVV